MGDYGIKIVKPERSLVSTNPDDYVFWSANPTLQLLEKRTVDITIGSGGCFGTEIVFHSWGFIPLVIGRVKQTAPITKGPYLMPVSDFLGISCSYGDIPNSDFSYKVKSDRVEISYLAECIEPMVGSTCPLSNVTFRVELSFYMWKLGSLWPL